MLTGKGIQLSPGIKNLPPQMTDEWIAHAVRRLDKNGDAYKALESTFRNGKYNVQKAVVGVNSNEVKLVILN